MQHRLCVLELRLLGEFRNGSGNEKGEDGTPVIVESEAEIVRMLYSMFMEGKTTSAIAKHMIANGVPTPGGRKLWQVVTVDSILSNEKYKGEALLQKTFTVDFLSKKIKENEGEVPQYYVQNSHPTIIDPVEFDAVQIERERRKKIGRPGACQSPLSAKLICGDCGGYYGSKVWSSNSKYRKIIWRCNEKYKGDTKCTTPHITEDEIKQKFIEAFNSILEYREELIANCRLAQKTLCDFSELNTKIAELHREIEIVVELSRKAIAENTHTTINQEEWYERNNGYLEKYKKMTEIVAETEQLKQEGKSKNLMIASFIKKLAGCRETLKEFDIRVWMITN